MEKLVSAIIINFNGEKDLKELIQSIKNQTYKKIEIIVWDNQSTDNSISLLKKMKVNYFIANKNYGYSEGTNKAIEKAKGEYILILNNDVVLEKNCIEELLKKISKKIVVSFPREFSFTIKKEIKEKDVFTSISYLGYGIQKKKPNKINFIPGVVFLIKKKIIDEMKYCFDKNFFMFYEDTDLSLRINAKGHEIGFAEKAIIWHKPRTIPGKKKVSNKAKKMLFFQTRNSIYCFYKLFNLIDFIKFVPLLIIKDLIILSKYNFHITAIIKIIKGWFFAIITLHKIKKETLLLNEKKRLIDSLEFYPKNISKDNIVIKYSEKYFKKIIKN
jgi:GT2 family glycosyltransferase